MLNNGVEVNARDNDGMTALMKLDKNCSDNYKMPILLARGADVNAVDKGGKTALMKAVESFQGNEYYLEELKARVALLIDSGANIGMKDKDGRTVFDLCKSEDLQQFILDAHKQYSSGGIGLK